MKIKILNTKTFVKETVFHLFLPDSEMSHLIIGSSNVYRFYSPELFPDNKKYDVTRCTNYEVFKAKMASLETTVTRVVIQVVENFLEDSV